MPFRAGVYLGSRDTLHFTRRIIFLNLIKPTLSGSVTTPDLEPLFSIEVILV